MSVLLRSDDRVEQNESRNGSPLSRYAAEQWVAHAQYEQASLCLRKAIEYLFDSDKPCFAAWLELYDIDTAARSWSILHPTTPIRKSGASPLYYAALCGFQDLVEHLIVRDPKQVNVIGGYYLTPLVAALAAGHFQTAKFLHDNGAHPNVKGVRGMTPLHFAAYHGEFGVVQGLLEHKADVKARNHEDLTPLHCASQGPYRGGRNTGLSLSNVARLLLEHGADVNAREEVHSTPLHLAAQNGRVEVVYVLLEHVANVNAENDDHKAAIQVVSEYVNTRDVYGQTPLHLVSEGPYLGSPNITLSNVARVLLEHGADVNARDNNLSTPLHRAAQYGSIGVVRVLLEHGASVGVENDKGKTPLQVALNNGHEITELLIEYGARL
jgi:cytohesin